MTAIKQINWGIIGCGDVTEIKSGPAFNKVPGSSLVAVMRRDAEKAADYARRHKVTRWYSDAAALINDPQVNAVYVATPPSSHKELTLLALAAGKPVYVEKPMCMNVAEAIEMDNVARQQHAKLVVAHYRREQEKFKKIQQLLADKAIGDVRLVQLNYYRKALNADDIAISKNAWRVDAAIAGGGLFHDIAPHQLDLMLYYFGEATNASGTAVSQSPQGVADLVCGTLQFASGVVFNGTWCFTVSPSAEADDITIAGSHGKIIFSAFGDHTVKVVTANGEEEFSFDEPQHVQQPMIEKVVSYFSGNGDNPCSAGEGSIVMKWMDAFTKQDR